MEASHLFGVDWLDLIEKVGIIGGLLLTAYSVRKDEKARKISNHIAITGQYRDVWKEIFERPSLSRLLQETVDLKANPISEEEALFVNILILHLDCVFRAMEEGMFVTLEGLRTDIKEFFILPIPKAIWETSKMFRDRKFVAFVESSRL